MTMQVDLRALLLSDAGLSAACGGRVHWQTAPQGGALPVLVLNRVSVVPAYTFGGEDALRSTRVQIDVWARTYAEAADIAATLRGLLSGFSGNFGETRFQGIFLGALRDFRDDGAADDDGLARVSADYIINHEVSP